MFAAVFVVTGAITAINYSTGKAANGRVDPEPADPAAPTIAAPGIKLVLQQPRPRLADRLSPHLRSADILALEAEDHYVRVYIASGSDLLLLRLADAMADLADLPGARTHRSWWVSRLAVQSATKSDGRGEVLLTNGVTAPVSRSAVPGLGPKAHAEK